MKSDGILRHLLIALVLALGCYAVFYRSIENRRVRKGPWSVTFTNVAPWTPAILINQPALAITNMQVYFPGQTVTNPAAEGTWLFSQAQPVPFDVPFGSCVFLDTTFLPGTVTLQLFGHEIELLPRVLIIDHQEHPWLSQGPITLHPIDEKPSALTTNTAR